MTMRIDDDLMWQREFFTQALNLMADSIEKRAGTTSEVGTIREVREIIRTIKVPPMKKGWRVGDTFSVLQALADRYPNGYKKFPESRDEF
jgi:hypothetical protein